MRKWLSESCRVPSQHVYAALLGLENNKGTPNRNAVEMNAIANFLFTVSDQPKYPAPPVPGDPENGKKLVGQVGCMACHVIDDKLMDIKPPATLKQYMDEWQYRRLRSQGPQLAGIGSKSDVNWIYAWIKNPKQYNPRTKMPNLRLSDQEAADIASYLATLHNDKTDQEAVPEVKPDLLDNETVEYLKVTLPDAEAQQKINDLNDLIEMYFVDETTMPYYQDPARMARDEAQLAELQKEYQDTFDDAIDRKAKKLAADIDAVKARMAAAKQKVAAMTPVEKKNVFLGSRLVARYGCFACHDIHGFETAKPIGTELSEWGAKPVDKLDFGLVDIEKDRIAWLKQKLHAPRSYDLDRVGVTRMPQELLKMPKFNLTDEQIDQIVTVIYRHDRREIDGERGAPTHPRGIPNRARAMDGQGVELRRLPHRRGAGRRDPRDGNPAGHGAADADRDADAVAPGPADPAGLVVQLYQVPANGRDSSLAARADADVRVDGRRGQRAR